MKMNKKHAFCPYCYDGEIVYLKLHNVFVCNYCHKEVCINEH